VLCLPKPAALASIKLNSNRNIAMPGAAWWPAGLLGLGVPDSDFCVNATYAQRLDDPSTYNFCR
jgi:hypothetical protein